MDTNLYEQRTRVQNQQTNTFLKGMDTDTSDMLLGSDQYRYAENVRIVTNTDNNSGEIHLIEGTKINDYIYPNETGDNQYIVASNCIRDIAVFIVVNKINNIPNSWCVYKKGQQEPLFGPCCEKIWNEDITDVKDIRNSITTVMRYESPNNVKLYIADSTGKHSIMVLNVTKQYGKDTESEYIFDKVFAYQRTLLPPAEVSIYSGPGNIVSGKVQYVYRLYSKNNPATPLSVLSNTLNLYKNEYSGYEAEKRSGRSVHILINNPENGLDYIQLYRISYSISGQLPKVSLIKDEKLSGSLIDTGQDIEELGISEFLSMFTPYIYPKQIESKGDYLFAANMEYSQDQIDSKFENFDSRSYSFGNYYSYAGNHPRIVSGQYNATTNTVQLDNIFVDDNHDIIYHWAFREGVTPEYDSQDWATYIFNYNDREYKCNGYGKYICWSYDFDNLNQFTPQNQGQIDYQKNTFRCGEVYRFGVKLYNEYGQSSSVKWVADIMIPDRANMYNDNDTTKFRNIGIKFFKTPGSDWSGISGWEIVRCERMIKDRKAITQGIIGFPFREYTKGQNDSNYNKTELICNPGILTTELLWLNPGRLEIDNRYNLAITENDIFIFSSPEYCYQQDDIQDIINSNKGGQLYVTQVYNYIPLHEAIIKTEDIHQHSNKINILYRSKQDKNKDLSYALDVIKEIDNPILNLTENSSKAYIKGDNVDSYISNYGDVKFLGFRNKYTRSYINYFYPDYTKFFVGNNHQTYIDDLSFIDSPKSDGFAKNEVLTFKNDITTIGNLQYINWSAPLLLNIKGEEEHWIKSAMDNYTDEEGITNYYNIINSWPIGSGGKAILFKQDQDENNKISISQAGKFAGENRSDYMPSVTVVNINKQCIPYNGYNKSSIENSQYISYGDYSEEDSVIVYSGDTYNRLFTYNASHIWYDSTYQNCSKMANVYVIPVETDIDIQAQYGTIYNVGGFTDYRIQDTADAFDSYTQSKGSYLYNPAYNATPDIIQWTTPEILETKQDGFDTRVHYSNAKTNNEDIDSWTQFQASNYIDVDTRYGEITDLKLFKDRLVFWQENATGILAVNERVVLNDQNDTQVVLGTGGVLERYDYISTVYGQKKNQHARVVTNDNLYWWDGNNKEILVHQQKFDSTPISTIKNVKNYINERDESETPFITYDNKYKEVLFNVVDNKSLVYNEHVQAFCGIYTFNPLYDFVLNGDLYLTDNDTIYKYNEHGDETNLFGTPIYPLIQYVVNALPTYNKTFDIQTIGGRFYGGGYDDKLHERNKEDLSPLEFTYNTPLKQSAQVSGDRLENIEYDYRLTIPRNGETLTFDPSKQYGNRLRGKFMKCQIKSNSNNLDFALQYITTKFRMSWT